MENKKILVAVLLVSILLLSGCAVKEYLKKYVVTGEGNFTLLSEKDQYLNESDVLTDADDITKALADFDGDGPQIQITVEENDTIALKPEGTDADEDVIVYTFSKPLNEEGVWKTNFGDAGKYIVTVTASDGELTTSKEVLIDILRKNVPPVIDGIPGEVIIDEGDIIKVNPNVTDPNGDEFTVDISDPIGNDGGWNTSYQDHGEYLVTITASDGELTKVQEMNLIVNRKNIAPIVEPIADIVINEGEMVNITPVVTDLNGDDITVSISDPVGDKGMWETAFTDHGEYTVTVIASDGELDTIVDINLEVKDVNVAPVILEITNIG
ncbi:hypothetical protein KY331_01225 [Candidatus Woesearchaeota archaeon]|nr:hypothetical protein [Candidatus Woesearchaeota archaeon]